MPGLLTIGRNPSLAELENWRFQVTSAIGGILVGRIRTTDATVTTLMKVAAGVTKSMFAEVLVVARQIGGSAGSVGDQGSYVIYSAWSKIGGVLTLLGTQTPRYAHEDDAAWQVEMVAIDNTPTVRVTGAVNKEITWTGQMRTMEVVQ